METNSKAWILTTNEDEGENDDGDEDEDQANVDVELDRDDTDDALLLERSTRNIPRKKCSRKKNTSHPTSRLTYLDLLPPRMLRLILNLAFLHVGRLLLMQDSLCL
jgi:hypothetical protein